MRNHLWMSISLCLAAGIVLVGGCGDDEAENAGSVCTTADDCYPDIDRADIKGAVACMDRVPDGYCTHLCTADADCCAVDGECITGFTQVCAPFESTGQNYCFLSCEGVDDETTFCQENAGSSFTCRSTGGGSTNRKICVPQ